MEENINQMNKKKDRINKIWPF